nr:hypothetical protein [Ardenticatenales bacterium]
MRSLFLIVLLMALGLVLVPTTSHGTSLPADSQPARAQEPGITVIDSDNTQFEAVISVPALTTQALRGPDAVAYTALFLPEQETRLVTAGEGAGQIGIPYVSYLVAIPAGSTPVLTVARATMGATMSNTLPYPVQRAPVDQEPDPYFGDFPFVRDETVYSQDRAFPAEGVVQVQRLGQLRGLELVRVNVATALANPIQRTLQPVVSAHIRLTFEGGTGFFLPQRALRAFESHFLPLYQLAVNYDAVPPYTDPDFPIADCIGYEMLIITPPNFRDEAEPLAAWKLKQGISTRIVEIGNGEGQTGSTKEEIRAYIKAQYDQCNVRPSYVLLFGDESVVPGWPLEYEVYGSDGELEEMKLTTTDHPYSVLHTLGDTETVPLPDIIVGRIPTNASWEMVTVVNKIINYEKAPPNVPAFYQNAMMASYFQCCSEEAPEGTTSRGYIATSEKIRDRLLIEGYGVQRIYNASTQFHPTYSGDVTPRYYSDGSALPPALAPGSGFAWNGDTAAIEAAFEAGRFLVIHRDHGNEVSWGNPPFGNGSVDDLDNSNRLPVVLSVECRAGVELAPAFLTEKGGGAVGVMAATGDTPTGPDDLLALGAIDAIWPDMLPDVGGDSSIRRLGNVVNYGKLYVIFKDWDSVQDRIMYMVHTFGDPTLRVWTRSPYLYPPLPLGYRVSGVSTRAWTIQYPVE